MPDQNPTQPQQEHKLRIELQHGPANCRRWIKPFYRKRFTQCIPMTVSIKFTNIGDSPFPGAIIKNFKITCTSDKLTTRCDKSVSVGMLNPNESISIEIDTVTLDFKGSAWVTADINPINESYLIRTFQYENSTKSDDKTDQVNKWGDTLYIQGELEYLQYITNILILLLTAITVFEALFGLKKTIVAFFRLVGVITRWFGDILLRITQ